MTNPNTGPLIKPADIASWPILRIEYRTDASGIAELLPPGIEPGAEPNVHLSIYNVPVLGEPEYGAVVKVNASYRGTEGQYALGYGIDQEAAIFISQELNGQPKYPCQIRYFRDADRVEAQCTHQGHSFIEFSGKVTGVAENPPDHESNEWWIKVSRAVGSAEKSYDFPPHVVRVHSTGGTAFMENLDGTVRLNPSPWDPIAHYLPLREQLSANLVTGIHKSREITLEGALDPDAFWPYADVIGGSRWPGVRGGPKKLA
ncbi:MAG: acetoacetate decarboxylase family protein [Deltaproteobacteria bacterium]|nr:acetoacetate decarboxylase family protein [Deltaproteobacteria bacterium]MBW2362886.1 acetoacetate decarboxylase family protein [Deltaproteobacteria bacterium]